MPWLEELQRGLGDALREIHGSAGHEVRYQLVTDLTTDPLVPTQLDIFMEPTPLSKLREIFGGRWQEVLGAGGLISPAAQPFFVVSRESLKVNDVLFDPSLHDTFRRLEGGVETGTRFRVNNTIGLSGLEPGFFLTVTTKFRDEARGSGGR